jgi:hypothetical protein
MPGGISEFDHTLKVNVPVECLVSGSSQWTVYAGAPNDEPMNYAPYKVPWDANLVGVNVWVVSGGNANFTMEVYEGADIVTNPVQGNAIFIASGTGFHDASVYIDGPKKVGVYFRYNECLGENVAYPQTELFFERYIEIPI